VKKLTTSLSDVI